VEHPSRCPRRRHNQQIIAGALPPCEDGCIMKALNRHGRIH
jgi:hypothetical protein